MTMRFGYSAKTVDLLEYMYQVDHKGHNGIFVYYSRTDADFVSRVRFFFRLFRRF